MGRFSWQRNWHQDANSQAPLTWGNACSLRYGGRWTAARKNLKEKGKGEGPGGNRKQQRAQHQACINPIKPN